MFDLGSLLGITYTGPPAAAPAGELPPELGEILAVTNGVIAFAGGLHVRGLVDAPAWHSLRHVMEGDAALSSAYDAVESDDVPFSQDALGDQFILRAGSVLRLSAETGVVEPRADSLSDFFAGVIADPMEYLALHPLAAFLHDGGSLEPGQLLSVYPPYCTKESADGVSFKAIPAEDRLDFLKDFSRQISSSPDGASLRIELGD